MAERSTEIERAKALYVELATKPERDRIALLERRVEKAPTLAAKTRASNELHRAMTALAHAQRLAGQIFDNEVICDG
jgi:hypothetical protein